jgi:hypothetical protein
MANGIVSWFRQALLKALNKEIDFDTDEIKVMLTETGYTPNLNTHDYKDDVTNELANGNGYTTGGVTLAGKTITYTAADALAKARADSTNYSLGDIVRPAAGNGHIYRCIVAGESGVGAPVWPVVSGQTVVDGAVTWAECGGGVIKLDANDILWANSTWDAPNGARYAVGYVNTGVAGTSVLLFLVDLLAEQNPNNGTFQITWDDEGILCIPVQ